MERYSLIVITDETAPIRRFDIPKKRIQQVIWSLGVVAVLFLVAGVDYVSVRRTQPEFHALKVETAEQRERLATIESDLAAVDSKLAQVRELERKIRIIANIPGSAATGGGEITATTSEAAGDLAAADAELPASDPALQTDAAPPAAAPGPAPTAGDDGEGDEQVSHLRQEARRLGLVADESSLTLAELIGELENKQHRLESSPAIWPAKGWLTSRYGYRISPFTGARQFHSGLDIAGAAGAPIIAPARGKVVYSGKRGPLGQTLILDHGYGVKTYFGHNQLLMVKKGEEVERGQQIATLGSTGRSTGPHLHYVVEVKGKSKNPLDYIFD